MAEGLTRKKQAEQTKRMLFEKGREVLRDVQSFDDFVVEDITDACGVSKGTFYLYFKSKGAFFYNIKLYEVNELRLELVTLLEDESVPVREALLAFVHQWLMNISEHSVELSQRWVSYLVDEMSRNTSTPEGQGFYDYHGLIVDRVLEGIRRREFVPDTPPDRIAYSFMVVLHGFDTLSTIRHELDYAEWANYAVEFVDKGILGPWIA